MGTRRYSRDKETERWQRLFDDLQARCRQAYLPPTIRDIRKAKIERGYALCRKFDCMRQGPTIWFANLPLDLTTWELRNRRSFICSRCWTPRADLILMWDGPEE